MNIFLKSFIVVGLVIAATIVTTPVANATNNNTACIDGSKRENLKVVWKSNSNVTVTSVGDQPLCADTPLFFSSYTLPDNYNGKGFGDPTATPQTLFNSTSIVLKKDVIPAANLTITLPEACKNMQVDVYYAPEITKVTPAGHGAQFISGYIVAKTEAECVPITPIAPTPPPVVPVIPTPAPSPAPVQPVTPAIPLELPKTGATPANTFAIAAILSVMTYAVVYSFTKRSL